LKHLPKSLVVLLILTCAWRYGRESLRTWLAHAARPTVAPARSSMGLPSGEHYSPGEDLERLDYEAIRSARRSVDIAMFSFTDVLLAQAVREAGRRGVRIRVYAWMAGCCAPGQPTGLRVERSARTTTPITALI
jgi:phosphatidylserine/phosphatidylglycerophosphate/cardiolipin synthase-like enzyme